MGVGLVWMREPETGWGQVDGVSIGDGGGHPIPDPPPSLTRLASEALHLCYVFEATYCSADEISKLS